jgi:hypothetical protein
MWRLEGGEALADPPYKALLATFFYKSLPFFFHEIFRNECKDKHVLPTNCPIYLLLNSKIPFFPMVQYAQYSI